MKKIEAKGNTLKYGDTELYIDSTSSMLSRGGRALIKAAAKIEKDKKNVSGKLTNAEQMEYMNLCRKTTEFNKHLEEVAKHNKKAKPDDKRQVDYSLNLTNAQFFRWNDLRTKGWE